MFLRVTLSLTQVGNPASIPTMHQSYQLLAVSKDTSKLVDRSALSLVPDYALSEHAMPDTPSNPFSAVAVAEHRVSTAKMPVLFA